MYGTKRNVGVVAVDVETTSLSPRRGGRIIEIAAVSLAVRPQSYAIDGDLSTEFHSLINPGVAVPYAARCIHGISDIMLRNQPSPGYTMNQFRQFIGDDIIVAHNAKFDMGFLQSEFRRCGRTITNRSICTLALSRKLLPGLPNYKLTTVYEYLFGELPDGKHHRALADAIMAGRIWLVLNR